MEINRKNLDILFRVFHLQFDAALENAPGDWRNFCGMNPNPEEGIPFPESFDGMFERPGAIRRRFERTVAIPREDIEGELCGLYSLLIARMGCEAGRFLRRLAVESLLSNPVWLDGSAFFHPARAHGGGTLCNTGESELSGTAVAAALEGMTSCRDGSGEKPCISPNLLIAGPSNKSAASAILRELPAMKTPGGNLWKSPVRLLILPELGKRWFLCASERNLKPLFMRLSSTPELIRSEDVSGKYAYGVSVRGEAVPMFPHLIYRGGAEE